MKGLGFGVTRLKPSFRKYVHPVTEVPGGDEGLGFRVLCCCCLFFFFFWGGGGVECVSAFRWLAGVTRVRISGLWRDPKP